LNDYIREKHPEFWYVWTHFQYHIQRVDAIRYFILKDLGGLYSDLDLMPNQNLDSYLEEAQADVLLVKSANEPCYTNMFMAARAPHLRQSKDCLWTRMIRHMVSTHKNPKW
jgi:inositol phosphorylceramide mannosyltransferase catalytic subunit